MPDAKRIRKRQLNKAEVELYLMLKAQSMHIDPRKKFRGSFLPKKYGIVSLQ